MSGISSMMFANFAAPAAGAEADVNTKILLHFDGANASTTITNSVTGGIAFTKGSNSLTYLQTAEKKFGTAAWFCNSPSGSGPGNNSGIYPTTKTLANGTWIPRDFWLDKDWTAEAQVYIRPNTAGGQLCIWWGIGTPRFNAGFWNTNSGAGMTFQVEMSTNGTYTPGNNGGAGYYNIVWTIGNSILNTWAHVALVRTGDALKLFINGTDQGLGLLTPYGTGGGQGGTGRTSANIFLSGNPYLGTGSGLVTGNLAIADVGGPYTDYGFRRSYMDEFRFGNGIARYTANFTAPTSAFPDV